MNIDYDSLFKGVSTELKPLYLIYGQEQYLVDTVVNKIKKTFGEIRVLLLSLAFSLLSPLPRRNLNYFSNAYAAAVSAVDPDAGNGELCIKVPSELWKHVDGKISRTY